MGVKLLFRCQICKDGFDLQLGDFRGLVDDHNTIRRHCGGRSRELVELSQLLACPRNDLSLGNIYIYIYIYWRGCDDFARAWQWEEGAQICCYNQGKFLTATWITLVPEIEGTDGRNGLT